VFDLGYEHYSLMNYGGCINLMKAAIECADRVTTVSPRYAQEILSPEYAHGLHHCLRNHQGKLCGILNGIDYDYYNPKTDPVIAQHFSAASIHRKYANKLALQRETGLPEDAEVPLLAIISRLATHKGLDLITEIAYNLLKEQNVQLVILGKGEAQYEHFFLELQEAFPDKVRALIQYDRDLSKRIYAAADIFLMPSRSEPCGLSQMIASRYGAIPVTRETGGLYDSIKGYWKEQDGTVHGNGFTFANYAAAELAERIRAALSLYENAKERKALIAQIMGTDFSWNASAKRYLDMYQSV
jgi:starch synthase